MIDEHTRESLSHLVERSITAEKLVADREKVFTARSGPPKVLWMDNDRRRFLTSKLRRRVLPSTIAA